MRDTINPKKVVLNYGAGNIAVQGEKLFWKGNEMHGAIVDRMVQMLQDGFPIEPLANFMQNMMENPSYRAVNELYGFLEKNRLPITPDGHFLVRITPIATQARWTILLVRLWRWNATK